MPNTVLTETMQTFIEDNYLLTTKQDIANRLGLAKGTVGSYLRRKNLRTPKHIADMHRANAINRLHTGPQLGDEVIKQFYLTLSINQLALKINRSDTHVTTRLKRLGLVIPEKIVEQRKRDGQFKPGIVPKNKGKKQSEYMSPEVIEKTKATRFKPGQESHSSLYDGAITMRHRSKERGGKAFYTIRISKNVWKELQIYNWEAVYGPVPKGHILACQDGNLLNCDVSNWKLMTKAENCRRNRAAYFANDDRERKPLTDKKRARLIDAAIKQQQKEEERLQKQADRDAKRLQLKIDKEQAKLSRRLERNQASEQRRLQKQKDKEEREILKTGKRTPPALRTDRIFALDNIEAVGTAKAAAKPKAKRDPKPKKVISTVVFREGTAARIARETLPTRHVDYTQKVLLVIDRKTSIYINAGEDPVKAKAKYLANREKSQNYLSDRAQERADALKWKRVK